MSRTYIAKVLKKLREAAGLTINDVGDAIGKSGKTVSAWENGRGQPDAEMLIALCDLYNVDNILAEFDEENIIAQNEHIVLSDHEKKVITAYRNKPHMQEAVDKLLEVTTENVHKKIDVSRYTENIAAGTGSEGFTNEKIKEVEEFAKQVAELEGADPDRPLSVCKR